MTRISQEPVRALAIGIITLAAYGSSAPAVAGFMQTNLVSDIPDLAAFTDPNLKNPWGIAKSATSPFWVSNQVSGNATLYNSAGQPQALVVTVPATGGPTGQVFNPTSDFALTTGGKALFLFANLNGSISGWNPAQGTLAQVVGSTSGAVYTGLALGKAGTQNFLYAADAAGNKIDVFNGSFAPTSLAGSFADPTLPAGFTVYNIQEVGGVLLVTYENEVSGGGVVNAFDANGNFLRRVSANAEGGPLDSPWGVTLAPSTFGPFGGTLLVGNEDDGHISAFDFTTGAFLGQLLDTNGNPIANTGLWGLTFGNGGNGGDPSKLYFAAGINDGANGLFGSIAAVVPEPNVLALLGIGLAGLGFARRKH